MTARPAVCGDHLQHSVAHAGGDRVRGIDRDHGADELGMLHGERGGNDTSEGVPDHHDRSGAQLLEQLRGVACEHAVEVAVLRDR